MQKTNILKLLAFIVVGTTMMYSQASRTWVSGVGDDVNPCSRTAPCKTWAGAISKTAQGGEIDALDPGGFGAVTITKSITLDGGGGQVASTLVAGTNGIVVQAGGSDVVILRNIRINGLLNSGNPGINGIRFTGGAFLSIENCDIFGFNTNGIDIALGANAKVAIKNTTVTNNAGAGIRATNSAGNEALVTIDNSYAAFNGAGFKADDHSRMSIRDSTSSNNGGQGLWSTSPTGDSVLICEHCNISNNGVGVQAGPGGAATFLADSTVSSNSAGFAAAGGANFTYGNNRIQGNTVDGTLPTAPTNGLR